MLKKVMNLIGITILTLGLMACGAKNTASESPDTVEEDAALSGDISGATDDTSEKEDFENTEVEAEEETELQVEEQAEEEEILETLWYMDEEGMKSPLLGLKIKKDNPMWDVGFSITAFLNNCPQVGISCEYYTGDVNSYMEEHTFYSWSGTGIFEGISYAYNDNVVFFVGNGLTVKIAHFGDIDIADMNDSLEKLGLIKSYEEQSADCLAYLTKQGIYCPVLGLKFVCDNDYGEIIGISCNCGYWDDSNPFEPISAGMRLADENVNDRSMSYYIKDSQNAQEVVDKFVEGNPYNIYNKDVERTAIEGTEEEQLGNYKYLGRGVVTKMASTYEEEERLFYSDEAEWSITITNKIGKDYKEYLSVLENLE